MTRRRVAGVRTLRAQAQAYYDGHGSSTSTRYGPGGTIMMTYLKIQVQ